MSAHPLPHHVRADKGWRLDVLGLSSGGPAKRAKELVETAKALREFREFMDSGRGPNILRQSEMDSYSLRFPRCDMLEPLLRPRRTPPLSSFGTRCPTAEALRPGGAELPHISETPATGCQLNDCDATLRFTGKVEAVAKGLLPDTSGH